MKKLLFVLVAVTLLVPSQASAGIKVGKALQKVAHVVAAPAKKPKASMKALGAAASTTFLAGVESVGVAIEGVGTVIEKVGQYTVAVGGVLAGK